MTGCTKISAGCDHCYAHEVAHRRTKEIYLRALPVRDTSANRADPFAPRFWPERLRQPLSWREPRRVFVNSMSDVFHAHFTFEMIRQVFEVMNEAPHHQFQLLTKRPERVVRFARSAPWSENIWLGTSMENMDVARRVDALREVPAAVRFISAEPLLGPLDDLDLRGIDWVIGGGESGHRFPRRRRSRGLPGCGISACAQGWPSSGSSGAGGPRRRAGGSSREGSGRSFRCRWPQAPSEGA